MKQQRVYLEVLADGRIVEGVPNYNHHCDNCCLHGEAGNGLCIFTKCLAKQNTLGVNLIYKFTGNRIPKRK